MNIALIDDHLILAESLQGTLTKAIADSDIRIFGNADDFLAYNFSQWQPNLVLTDILMPGTNGVDLIEKALPMFKGQCKFLLMSSVTDAYTVKSAIRKGAKGYITKGASLKELIDAIKTVQDGNQYISPSLKENLLNYMLSNERPVDTDLSPREKEVLQRICSGRTPKEIAFDMQLSIHTIHLYNKAILRKFKLNRTTDLVAFAIQKGLYKVPGM